MAARISWSLPIVTMLAAVVGLLVPLPVRADLEIMVQEDGGSKTVLVDNKTDFDASGVHYNGTFGDFMINCFGVVTHNAAEGSDLLTSKTLIKNVGTGTHTLTIYVSQNNYSLPTGPDLTLTSSFSGNVITGGAGQSLAFQSYANNNNQLFSTDQPVSSTALQTPNVSVARSPYDSAPDPGTLFARTSSEYSVTTTNAITLVVGGTLTFASSTTLVDPPTTPAPAGLVLVLTALPALGVGGWLRRRHRKATGLFQQTGNLAT